MISDERLGAIEMLVCDNLNEDSTPAKVFSIFLILIHVIAYLLHRVGWPPSTLVYTLSKLG